MLKGLGLAFAKSLINDEGESMKKLVKAVVLIICGIAAFFIYFLTAIPVAFLHIPAAEVEEIAIIKETVEKANEAWEEDYGVEVPWEEVAAVAGVYFEQQYFSVSEAQIRNLAREWIEREESEDSDGKKEVSYRLRSFMEVLEELGFNDIQMEVAENYRVCLEDEEAGMPPGDWVANPSVGWRWPVPGYESSSNITSSYGYRIHPIKLIPSFHSGVDIGAPSGTPVVAARNGVIEKTGKDQVYGNYVIIKSYPFEIKYAHLSRIHVKKGEEIKDGDKIASVGSTGMSTGPHLHFEVTYLDALQNPLTFY